MGCRRRHRDGAHLEPRYHREIVMAEEPKVFTVELLIDTLAAFPSDMPVFMRLDDLLGEVTHIKVESKGGAIVVLESN